MAELEVGEQVNLLHGQLYHADAFRAHMSLRGGTTKQSPRVYKRDEIINSIIVSLGINELPAVGCPRYRSQ